MPPRNRSWCRSRLLEMDDKVRCSDTQRTGENNKAVLSGEGKRIWLYQYRSQVIWNGALELRKARHGVRSGPFKPLNVFY